MTALRTAALPPDPGLATVPASERHFYARTNAFGRFGMRLFEPQVMPNPHWHGHIEANFLHAATMIYDMNGDMIQVPEGRLCLFWAALPHRLVSVQPTGSAPPSTA